MVAACCFLLTLPSIIDSFMGSDLMHEVMARKIAYCAWQDPSLEATHYPINTLLVIAVCWAPVIATLGISLKIGYPKWFILIFIVATCLAGVILFTPQLLAHYHFQRASTQYFVRNIAVSAVCSTVTIVTILLHQLKTKQKRPNRILLACSYFWILIAFHFTASFFYIFNPFCAIE